MAAFCLTREHTPMTPEERERTMEFSLEQQAQFFVALQREHEDRVKDRPRLARLEAVFIQLTELAQIQSRRIEQNERTSKEMLSRLDRILDRLVDKN